MAPNTTQEKMDKSNKLTIYGLIPTTEFQMVKCCSDVI